jgi:hypothetical protein
MREKETMNPPPLSRKIQIFPLRMAFLDFSQTTMLLNYAGNAMYCLIGKKLIFFYAVLQFRTFHSIAFGS